MTVLARPVPAALASVALAVATCTFAAPARADQFVEAALALARRWRLGGSVLEAVDPDLRPFYDRVLRASLDKGRRWSHDFDCSGRCKSCRYRIEVRPLPAARGLIVPTLKDADRRSIRELARDFAGLVARARDEVSLSLLQRRLIDLGTGIQVVMG